MRLPRIIVLISGLFWNLPVAEADDIKLAGSFIQGGLAFGQVAPGSAVTFDGRSLAVSADGNFLIGFGRDNPSSSSIEVTGPDGPVLSRSVAIKQRTYRVQRIDGLPPRQVTPSPADLKRIRAESKLMAAARSILSLNMLPSRQFLWPAKGRMSGVYGSQRILNGKPRRPHYGIDIAAPEGTEVFAPGAGVIRLAHAGMFFNGKTILLDHGHGLHSVFLHLSVIAVEAGQRVRRGQPLGRIGNSGRATGPHLHWGLRWRRTELDPALLLPPTKKPN